MWPAMDAWPVDGLFRIYEQVSSRVKVIINSFWQQFNNENAIKSFGHTHTHTPLQSILKCIYSGLRVCLCVLKALFDIIWSESGWRGIIAKRVPVHNKWEPSILFSGNSLGLLFPVPRLLLLSILDRFVWCFNFSPPTFFTFWSAFLSPDTILWAVCVLFGCRVCGVNGKYIGWRTICVSTEYVDLSVSYDSKFITWTGRETNGMNITIKTMQEKRAQKWRVNTTSGVVDARTYKIAKWKMANTRKEPLN